jgi:hypothetical protein
MGAFEADGHLYSPSVIALKHRGGSYLKGLQMKIATELVIHPNLRSEPSFGERPALAISTHGGTLGASASLATSLLIEIEPTMDLISSSEELS